ncbi:sugar transferase [Sphingomonas sp. PR090111-T3T-6A]|uniref:sugar transferase n=1 Tax=Sphingomonas sp. PR090111-T3T-6A TaxID=685778 RepID=UPI00056231E8|nr:sugar transferase [Sphingomonas sp. PR090111-T3T-6A]
MTVRRCIDILISVTALGLLAPLLLLFGLVLLLVDGSPVLFVQTRSGLGGRPFRLVKFRTMNEARGACGTLLSDAERTTPIGRLLRGTRIDELPQFWNVLLGDMSLIGPRPLLPITIAAAGDAGRERGQVLPGMTGWAQVNGNTLLSDADKIALDLWYIRNRTAALDLRIIGRTLLVGLLGERRNAAAIGRAHAGASHRRG